VISILVTSFQKLPHALRGLSNQRRLQISNGRLDLDRIKF
jgi:hypothetical protein